jgi:monofunctional biosynthetic peptidoglycan transglycosylase
VVRGLAALVVIALAGTVIPVLLARFVDPPVTWTMIGVVRDHHAKTGEWAWVEHASLPLDQLGPCGRVVVASEDNRFWHHHGFDFGAIQEAMEKNAEGGRLRGASTISQQVARNVFLWQTRSWLRKGLETWYTVWLELLVPKARILELYCNVAQTGPLTFGFEAAARHWYGVPAKRLTLDQGARIAAILPSPARRDPRAQSARARAILARLQPFPGEKGFDAAGRRAREGVGLGALLGVGG